MFRTYEFMSRSVNQRFLELPEEELALIYREAEKVHDQKTKDQIIASLVVKHFPMMLKIQKRYYNLSLEEKGEIMLDCIVIALQRYDRSKAKTKFTTYLFGNINRAYISKITYYQTDKRKAWFNRTSNSTDFKLSIQTYSLDDDIFSFVKELDTSSILNVAEKEICKNLTMGYKTNKDISQRVSNAINHSIAPNVINKLRKKIKEKVKTNGYSVF